MNKGLKLFLVGLWFFNILFLLPPSAKALVTLKLGCISAPSSALGQGLTLFAKLIEEKTKGEVKVNIGFSSSFGSWAVQMQSVESGALDMMVEDIGIWEYYDSAFRIFRIPYVFRDYDHYVKFLNSPILEESKRKVMERNHRFLLPNREVAWRRGPYRVLVSKKPVFNAEDVKGLKLRLYESETAKKVWGQALGATITVIPYGETFLALRQGMVDSVTAPIDMTYDMKFTEVCKYVTNINEFFQTNTLAIGEKRWKSFSPSYQKAMNEAVTEMALKMNVLLDDQVEKDIQRMTDEHGASFIRVGLNSFRDKIFPLIDELEKQNFWPKGLYGRIQEIK
jgi:TRAP-type C4-dicarboxylate transport system substrate-binding protein